MSFIPKCYNSVLGAHCEVTGKIKGEYVFTYCWDKNGGHYPNVRDLAAANNLSMRGQAEDKDFADTSGADLVAEQKTLFGQGSKLVDDNRILGKSVITTLELFTYFAVHNIFSIDSLSANAAKPATVKAILIKNTTGMITQPTTLKTLRATSLNDSKIICELESSKLEELKRELEEEKRKCATLYLEVENQKREISDLNIKLEQAVRGRPSSGDLNSETVLFMVGKQLEGMSLVNTDKLQAILANITTCENLESVSREATEGEQIRSLLILITVLGV